MVTKLDKNLPGDQESKCQWSMCIFLDDNFPKQSESFCKCLQENGSHFSLQKCSCGYHSNEETAHRYGKGFVKFQEWWPRMGLQEILHHAFSHTANAMIQFLEFTELKLYTHLSYKTVVTQCDYFNFPRVKNINQLQYMNVSLWLLKKGLARVIP